MHSETDPHAALAKLKTQLQARGSMSIQGLSRTFRIFDNYDGNRRVDGQEFFVGLQEYGCDITKAEAAALLKYFDKDGDGNINFDEFLVGVRGGLNEKRQAVTDKAFAKFDKDGSGEITAADLRGVYNASHHPKVRSGEMTEEDVFREFLQHFGDDNHDGKITKQEWNDHYAAISSSVDNDDEYVLMMVNAWRL